MGKESLVILVFMILKVMYTAVGESGDHSYSMKPMMYAGTDPSPTSLPLTCISQTCNIRSVETVSMCLRFRNLWVERE